MIRPMGESGGEAGEDGGLVDVGNYPTALAAEIDRARLLDEGIDAFVFDGMFASATLAYTDAIGGVRLKVRRRDREKAKALLAADAGEAVGEAEFSPEDEIDFTHSHCPACHSADLDMRELRVDPGSWLRPWAWMAALFAARRDCRCRACGHTWKE